MSDVLILITTARGHRGPRFAGGLVAYGETWEEAKERAAEALGVSTEEVARRLEAGSLADYTAAGEEAAEILAVIYDVRVGYAGAEKKLRRLIARLRERDNRIAMMD